MGCGCGKSFTRRTSTPVNNKAAVRPAMATPQRMPAQHQSHAPQHIVQASSLAQRRAAANRRQV